MNEEILNRIQENLPVIAEKLQVATTQVWDKVLWYVRVGGVVEIIEWGIFLSLFVPVNIWILKKAKTWDLDEDGYITLLFLGFILEVVALLVLHVVIPGLMGSIMKVIVPEYWIMDQIITKVFTGGAQ